MPYNGKSESLSFVYREQDIHMCLLCTETLSKHLEQSQGEQISFRLSTNISHISL